MNASDTRQSSSMSWPNRRTHSECLTILSFAADAVATAATDVVGDAPAAEATSTEDGRQQTSDLSPFQDAHNTGKKIQWNIFASSFFASSF